VVRYPLVNALASPTRYESEPRSLFDAVRDMRRRGLDILAVYHSHPTSPPLPSRLDRELNYGPDVVHFIVSLSTEPPTVRGWWLTETDHREAEWSLG
jgi:proteasome lid subunit RPN8/RPN11